MNSVCRLAAAALVAAAMAAPARAELTVTAIDHAGFLFSDGKTKILVDALTEPSAWPYRTPSPALLAKLEKGEAPFDGVSLLLISHNHIDHYSPPATLRFLAGHPQALVITTRQVRAELAKTAGFDAVAGRIVTPDVAWKQRLPVTVNGFTIELDRLKHGDDGQWASDVDAFVFTLGGKKVLYAAGSDGHFPDEYREFGYGARGLDLAFFNFSIAITPAKGSEPAALKADGVTELKTLIGAKTTVLLHVTPEAAKSVVPLIPALAQELPGATWFATELESRTY